MGTCMCMYLGHTGTHWAGTDTYMYTCTCGHTHKEKTHAHIQDSHRHTRAWAHRGHWTAHMGCSVNETCAKRTAWPFRAEAFRLWVLQAEGKGETAAPRARELVFMGSSPGSWLRGPSCTSSLEEGLCSRGGGGLPLPDWAPWGSANVLTTTQTAGHSGRHPVLPSAESLGHWAAHGQGQPWADSQLRGAQEGTGVPSSRAPHLCP